MFEVFRILSVYAVLVRQLDGKSLGSKLGVNLVWAQALAKRTRWSTAVESVAAIANSYPISQGSETAGPFSGNIQLRHNFGSKPEGRSSVQFNATGQLRRDDHNFGSKKRAGLKADGPRSGRRGP
ncbi:uncharacterized protein KD926_002274 [Aspergillus affinis]|uniref:uncharacterized protein n=1 Tax=Aspergillus affinis TaxID=1070780 RepID=UPI0022FE039D|nr:uncharacterized protein KD926_002274 [Aspergillus affinis]KAI9036133.1 hypothetical protein KD926_002274 [Aspergillus affinis]